MLERWRAAGLIWPTIMTALLLPVLVGLGTWQWHRKQWKEDLIAKIEARIHVEPVSYTAALAKYVKDGDVDYLRVRVPGTFDHTQERHLYFPGNAGQGWNIYTLFRPEGGFPLFVNRGWVPDKLKDPATRAAGQLAGPVTVVGLVRLDQAKSVFTPANDTAGNRWFARNSWAMRWGTEPEPSQDKLLITRREAYAPFTLDAEAEPANSGGWPRGGTTEVRLFNSHLQYVVTWYGLALTLLGVFGIFARQRLSDLDASSPG